MFREVASRRRFAAALRAQRGMSQLLLWTLLPLGSLVGCNRLDEFRTGDRAAYTGEIIGSDGDQSKPSFIRQGFASHTRMTLTFDPSLASAADTDAGRNGLEAPGTIDTYVCPGSNDDCAPHAREAMEFDHAPLERISNLMHDALSEYDFPGGGRLRNYVFFARTPEDADAAASQRVATVFISLLDNGRVEVRVIAPSVLDSDGETELLPPLFGVFLLKRHAL